MTIDWTMEQVGDGLAGGEIIIVDVREPHEFAMGRIPGSLTMPLSCFDPAALPVEPGKRVVLSCAAGVRSLHAMRIAQAAGLPIDTHYVGGFKEWASAGGEIERD